MCAHSACEWPLSGALDVIHTNFQALDGRESFMCRLAPSPMFGPGSLAQQSTSSPVLSSNPMQLRSEPQLSAVSPNVALDSNGTMELPFFGKLNSEPPLCTLGWQPPLHPNKAVGLLPSDTLTPFCPPDVCTISMCRTSNHSSGLSPCQGQGVRTPGFKPLWAPGLRAPSGLLFLGKHWQRSCVPARAGRYRSKPFIASGLRLHRTCLCTCLRSFDMQPKTCKATSTSTSM